MEKWTVALNYWRGIFLLVMVAIGGYGTLKFLNATDGAAWIQCIWSVIAVFFAIIVPEYQAQVKEGQEHRRQMKLLASIVRFTDSHLAMAAAAKNSQEEARNFFGRGDLPRFVAARTALADFPVTAFKTVKEVEDLMQIRAAVAESVHLMQRGIKGDLAEQRALVLVAHERSKVSDRIKRLSGPDSDHMPT